MLSKFHGVTCANLLQFDKNDPDTLVGVIARSAGVWDSKCFSQFPFLHSCASKICFLDHD